MRRQLGRGRGRDGRRLARVALVVLVGVVAAGCELLTPGGPGGGAPAATCAQYEALLAGNDHPNLHSVRSLWAERCLRLNQVQLVGSHNSYHDLRASVFGALQALQPAVAVGFEYTHTPLETQFQSEGVRQIELDVFADPDGGRYATPALLPILENNSDPLPGMSDPGFKVFHVQEVDFESTCVTLVVCLTMVKSWSDAHPVHLPITILIEAKDDPIPDDFGFGFVQPIPIGPAELDAIDAEIRSVFPEEQLLTPDDVRGTYATLEDAVLTEGWPVLEAARGQVLFALDNGGGVRDDYLAGHPSLTGRVMFADGEPGDDHAAFMKRNDPVGPANQQEIQDLVAAGYVVRTRADADTVQARTNDPTMRDAAFASGATWVSTDYPTPARNIFGNGYWVDLPGGGRARCNPVSAPAACRDTLFTWG